MTRWTITIPRAIVSQNRAPSNKGAARYGYKTERTRWAWDVGMAAKAAGIPLATGRRRVVITRLIGKGQREYDIANLWGGAKALIDVLTVEKRFRGSLRPGTGLIVDDSEKWADIVMRQERAADGQPGTRIEISEVTT